MSKEHIPESLKIRAQWLLWRFEPNPKKPDGKPLKVPYWTNGKKRTGTQGDAADRSALVTFDKALEAYKQVSKTERAYSGIGFAFLPGDGLIGIDIDACLDPDTGEVSDMANELVDACHSYTERSPSRTGLHIIVAGETKTFKSDKIGLEVFCGRQFFTFSGDHFGDSPTVVTPIQDKVLDRMRSLVEATRAQPVPANNVNTAPPPPVAQSERARIESALMHIPADEHGVWIKVCAALYNHFGDDGYRLWDYWSSKSGKYAGAAETLKKWDTFKDKQLSATIASVFWLAQQHGWKPPRSNALALVKPLAPPPPVEEVTPATLVCIGDGEISSAEQALRGEEIQLAGQNSPETFAAMGGGGALMSASSPTSHDGRRLQAVSNVGQELPLGQSAALFSEGPGSEGQNQAAKDKPKKVYDQDHWDRVHWVLETFVLIYGEDLVWDRSQRMLMKISSMRAIVANSDVMKFWNGPARDWVLKKNIVFDPTEKPSLAKSGPTATVNLFSGWKMRPKRGGCSKIKKLLLHLCNGNEETALWIHRWIAYPPTKSRCENGNFDYHAR